MSVKNRLEEVLGLETKVTNENKRNHDARLEGFSSDMGHNSARGKAGPACGELNVGMLFHVIVITQRNNILKFYNILQDH